MRRTLTIYLLTSPFALCIVGPWAWFNTDIGRPSPASSLRSATPRIWLSAKTNIPGYIFIAEPVSDAVKKTLGTTNILSGSFYRIDVSSQQSEISDQKSVLTSDLRHLTSGQDLRHLTSDVRRLTAGNPLASRLSSLDASRVTIFLASWPAGDSKGLTAIQHTPDICWGGSGWKPLNLGQPQQILIQLPIAEIRDQKSEVRSQKSGVRNQC